MAARPEDEQLLRRAYAAFNARDIDAALVLMAPGVDWPNGMEGGRVAGREAVRAYWTRQFGLIDSRVEPNAFTARDDGRVAVDVHQVVRSLDGDVISDGRVVHVYAIEDGLVARMDIEDPPAAAEPHTHRYHTHLTWSGSTAGGIAAYDRSHTMNAPPAAIALALSSDPAFRGDPAKLNPEQLLVLAASSCQMLSFLAVAARARIDVVAYEDDAEGFMPEDDRPMRIARIVLRPHIAIRGEVSEERLRRLVETAHRECFIANSLRTEIAIEPRFSHSP
ncbi:MAG TPA: OsmC family protein [Conexibacter sp.]|nr:OsmC family protein [Conexibacter sp.]